MKKIDTFWRAVAAGISISIGAAAYLSCSNKIVGAFLFTVGLFTICFFKLDLFTGKIGYFLDTVKPLDCLLIWFGNGVGCILGGVLLRFGSPNVAAAAAAVTEAKLDIPLWRAAILGLFCGMLMYIAVHNYLIGKHVLTKCIGVLVCIPAFIICGFEHCIANIVYFAAGISKPSQIVGMLLMTLVVSLANGIGAVAFRRISLTFRKEN